MQQQECTTALDPTSDGDSALGTNVGSNFVFGKSGFGATFGDRPIAHNEKHARDDSRDTTRCDDENTPK